MKTIARARRTGPTRSAAGGRRRAATAAGLAAAAATLLASALPAAGAGAAGGDPAGGDAAGHWPGPVASADAAAPFTLWAPRLLEATAEGPRHRVWVDWGVRAVAGSAPLEVRTRRTDWDEPITGTWTAGDLSGTVPPGLQRTFQGLTHFLRVEIRDRRGRLVQTRRMDACFGNGAERARPDAPATSPYPFGCPWNPFTVGSVQGVQAGWAAQLAFDTKPLRLAPGRYDVRIGVNPRWADAFGLPQESRRLASVLRVQRSDHEHPSGAQHEHDAPTARPATPSAPPAPPAAAPPATDAAGSAAGPRPDLRSLPAHGIELNGRSTHLRFSATVWNAGDSPLVVDGFRRGQQDVMDAYQYFFDAEGEQVGHQLVGEMRFHRANHQHWHFQDFARYRLLHADRSVAATSGKVSFCLANTDAIDYTVPGADWKPEGTDLSTACGTPGSLAVREVLASGSGDTYAQYRAGQAFKVEGLPNGWYWISVEANPSGNLVEHDTTDNVSLRRIHLGGRPGARIVKVPPVGLVDETMPHGFGG
ncbi:lysyl oxidase family protein [Nocardioides solisilvae]|uniref:lysyl oxidase family protein n=1 Tax=Nocardioides solisilvae TaxID=1542435 RepID=UPI000D742277|nr:lysyl oxidase family protein [Nocardioides solisilvae]